MNKNTLAHLSARLDDLLTSADDEAKRWGQPSHDLVEQLDTIEAILDAGDAQTATARRQHAAFVRTLRFGPRIDDLPHLKLAAEDAEWQQQKVMTQADDVTGGFLCSDEFVQQVIHQLAVASPARQIGRVIPVGPSTGGLVPVLGSLTAHRVQETEDRNALAADPDVRLARFGVFEASAMALVSRHLVQDARYDLGAELALAAANGFAALEAQELITGTGFGLAGLNLSDIPAAQRVTCGDATGHLVTPDDILKLAKAMPAAYVPGAKLLLNPTLLFSLRGVKDATAASYLAPVMDTPTTFMGFPIVLCSSLASNATPAANNIVAYLVNPASYVIAQREAMVVQRLNERFIEEGKIGFSFRMRNGGGIVLPEGVARLVTA